MLAIVYLLAASGATGNAYQPPTASKTISSDERRVTPPPPPAVASTSLRGPNMAATPRTSPGSWVSEFDYPLQALRESRSGNTSFRVVINKWGRVSDCQVTESSGHADLDKATCNTVGVKGLFWPQTDGNSNSIDGGTFSSRIRWAVPAELPPESLPAAPPLPVAATFVPTLTYPRGPIIENFSWNKVTLSDYPPLALKAKAQGISQISFVVNVDGSRQDCRIVVSSGNAELDAKSCIIATERAKTRPAQDINGNSTKGRIDSSVEWRIPLRS